MVARFKLAKFAIGSQHIQTADFVPLDFETRPLLSLVPVSLLDSASTGLAITTIFITEFMGSELLRMGIMNFVI